LRAIGSSGRNSGEFDVIGCKIFGHICPVYFVAEPFTETKHRRSNSRSIPREIMLKVVRRDGQICQKCNEPVADDEVEFDRVIPFSRGGAATVENLRLVHRSCNRRKGASLRELLSEDPVRDHYFAAKNRRPKR
jgi:hypothetical protein